MKSSDRVGVARIGLALMCSLVLGCAAISEEAKQKLEGPVMSCEMAPQDIALLEDNKASGGVRFLQGAQGILPPAIVISVVRSIAGKPRGLYLDHWKIAFGVYRIDARVGEIRRNCG